MRSFETLLSGRNRHLLMCIAILWIIGFHYSLYGNLLHIEIFQILFGNGYLGVDIFFFLSAYGLCHSFQRHTAKVFYIRRIKKIFPVYLFFLAAYFLFFYKGEPGPWWKVALLQISGLSTFTQIDIEWFIPSLIILYISFPLLFRLIKLISQKSALPVCLVVTALSFMSQYISKFIFYLFAPRLVVIVVGIFTYLAIQKGKQSDIYTLYAFCGFLGLLFIGFDKVNVSQTGSLFIPLILFFIARLATKIPPCKAVEFIGVHTMEIYLAQNLAFNHFMASYQGSFGMNSIISILIVGVGTFVFVFLRWAYDKISDPSRL